MNKLPNELIVKIVVYALDGKRWVVVVLETVNRLWLALVRDHVAFTTWTRKV